MDESKVLPRARLAVCLGVALLVNACGGGGGDATPVAQSDCAVSIAADGSITWPAVRTGDTTYVYTLTPSPTEDEPLQYLAVRQPADTTAGCPAVAFDPNASQSLAASNFDREGQSLSISFDAEPGSDGLIFSRADASVSGGLLNGTAGDDLLPLANATVTVLNATGQQVAQGTTNEYGALIVGLDKLPDDFKVVATGGTMSGKPFIGSLKAEVEAYTTIDANPSITVTPVSTIVAAYRERNPDLSVAEAMTTVKAQLGMPNTLDIDSNLQGTGDYFDNAAFYAAADSVGGVDLLVQAVLSDWDAGVAHSFVPASDVDRQEPSVLMKELLPADELPDYKQSACGSACMRPQSIDIAVSVVGKLWSVYSSYKSMQFTSDVIANLNQINAELKNIKSELGDLKAKLNNAVYDAAYVKIEKWRAAVEPAFGALHWFATNPRNGYPANQLAAWDVRAAANAKIIRNVIKTVDLSVDEVLRDIVAETRGDPMAKFQEAVAGKPSKVGQVPGMLQEYREFIYSSRTGKDVAAQRLFFRPEDSNAIWDHYRYWESLQAQTYLFLADYLEANGQEADLASLKTAYAAALAAEKAAMPMRVLPRDTAIDPFNKFFNGSSITGPNINGAAVGGPMMYARPQFNPGCPSSLNPRIAFDAPWNETVQVALGTYLDCANSAASPYLGLRDWRIPTYLEWQAFTLTSGNPNPGAVTTFEGVRFATVGDWMGARGFNPNMEGQLVYAASTACDGSISFYDTRLSPARYVLRPCSSFKVNFQYISGSFRPFIWFGGNHTVDLYANKGSTGYVFLTRPVNVNEYW
jgi:hypothetical protein